MVDWGKFPPLSSTAAPSADVDQTAGINSSWHKRSGLGLAPGPRSDGGDGMSLILCSDVSLFLDNLNLSPVFMLSGMDFQDALGSSADSFANLASLLNGLLFLDTVIEVDVAPMRCPRRSPAQYRATWLTREDCRDHRVNHRRGPPGPGEPTQVSGSSR